MEKGLYCNIPTAYILQGGSKHCKIPVLGNNNSPSFSKHPIYAYNVCTTVYKSTCTCSMPEETAVNTCIES